VVANSREMFEQAAAMTEAALAQSRVESAQSESRIARLRLALAHKAAGDEAEHDRIVAEIRAEQEAL
jgi:hypothetical protein